jgi:hypothetical protein
MRVEDINGLRQSCWLSRNALHVEARDVLNQQTTAAGQGIDEEDLADGTWPHWKEYVAFHKECEGLVGPGVVAVTGQRLAGTKDPNRRGAPRYDFVLHHQDGGYVRIHPGNKPKSDAAPKYFPNSATEHVGSPSRQWMQMPMGGVYTTAHAALVPQTDRIGKQRAWQIFESLDPTRDQDLTDGSKFLWWLWVANFGPLVPYVVGPGILGAQFIANAGASRDATVVFTRNDQSSCFVTLRWKVKRYGLRLEMNCDCGTAAEHASERAAPPG